jgi:hypothetical protein
MVANSPPPDVAQTNHKAWTAGIAAAVLPIILQNIFGANDAFSTLYDWFAHVAFGTAAVPPEAIASAVKSLVTAVGGGIATGMLTWLVNNRLVPVSGGGQVQGAGAGG